MEEDTHDDYGPQDDIMKAMQSELQMKGVLMSKAWADLFGLFTKYQGELIRREHQLAVAQKEIIAKERHFKSHDEKFFKDSDLALIQSESIDKTHQISNLETDIRLKDDLLEKAKNEISVKEEQLFKAQVDLKRLQYDMATKQEQLLAKDRLISRMQDEMAKESAELMVQIYQLREALKEEKMSHDRTRATSENFLKNLQNAKQNESTCRYEPPCRDTETPSENTSSSNSGAVIIEDRVEEKETRKVAMPEFNDSGVGRVPKIRHFMARDRHSPPRRDTSPQLHERQQMQPQQQQQQQPQQPEHAVQRVNVRPMNCVTSSESDVKPDLYVLQRQWRGTENKVGLDLSLAQRLPNSHAMVEKDQSRVGLTWTTCSNSNVVENIIQSFTLEPDRMPNSSANLNNSSSPAEVHYSSAVVSHGDRQPVFPGLIQPGSRPTIEISDGRSKSESSSNQEEGLQTSSSNQDGSSPPVCVPCKKVFFNEISYRKHLKNSHDRRFKCEECGKSFGTRIYLQIHLRTHTGEKPYKCKDCKKRFSVQSSLLRHIRIHTGEKPYKCEQCGWAFAVRSNLIQHIRTHSGERPYQCQYCMVRFTRQNSLQKHIVMTHSKEVANNPKSR